MSELTPSDALTTLARRVLDMAREGGATEAEVSVSDSRALSVRARNGDVESLEFQRDRDLHLSVYIGRRSGSAVSSDWTDAGLRAAVRAACDIARATGEDPCNGLPDPQHLAREFPDLDLEHPWALRPEDAIEMARQAEAAALAVDRRIRSSEDASVDTRQGVEVLANTHGFVGIRRGTQHSLACGAIAVDGDDMQRDHDYALSRVPDELPEPAAVGERAARQALARLGAKRPKSGRVPVLFRADLARGLIGHFLGAVSGGALYRRSSFLLDSIGQPLFPDWLSLRQRPFIRRAIGSAAFDHEGVATRERELVSGGVIQGYLLGSYAARRLNMEPTGNAGGVFNLEVSANAGDLSSMIRDMGTGLLLTELMGQGVNTVTGDYSRGASGFWVENGEIAGPVDEATIAGNLRDIYAGIVAVGSDIDTRGSVRTGSILVDGMTVAA